MSDIVEDVAKAIVESDYRNTSFDPEETWNTASQDWRGDWIENAEAAIAAAEPHFRRKHRQELYDELAAKAEKSFESYLDGNFYISRDEWYQDVSAWLMVQKRKEVE